MIEKTVYVSDDGKTFTNQKQCQDYELNVLKKNVIAPLWHNNVTMYNYKGEKISTRYDPETEPQKFVKFIKEKIDSTVMFLRINPKCTAADWRILYTFFSTQTQTSIPTFFEGHELWRYDSDGELWHSYKEDIERLKENWGSFCTID